MALREEVDTKSFVLKALSLGKKVYLPRIHRREKQLGIYWIERLSDLRRGPYGIYEPRPRKHYRGRPEELDLVVIPGLGFDRRGARLGRGQGYFDQLLKKTKKAYKIGVAFREQIVKKIPVARHDVCVDRVITDEKG